MSSRLVRKAIVWNGLDAWLPPPPGNGFVGEDAGAREPHRVVTAEALRHMELRLPVAAALSGNDDYAIRGPGAVNRGGRRRALQHLHRLHVAGDEVGQPIGAVVLARSEERRVGKDC